MKIPYFSIIGLLGLYLLIFRNEDINSRQLHMQKVSLQLTPNNDTIPQKPLYVDIYTGQPIDIRFDSKTMMTMNTQTNMPVDFYINTSNWDTVYGKGQFVVNNLVVKNADGKYQLDESKVKMDGDELKIKDGNRKLKIDGDEIKIKEDGAILKYDQKDGQGKVKMDSTKMKSDDGTLKLKSGNDKWKEGTDKSKSKEGSNKKKSGNY